MFFDFITRKYREYSWKLFLYFNKKTVKEEVRIKKEQ